MTDTPATRLYLITPALDASNLAAFAPRLAEALAGAQAACVLARLASGASGEAKRIIGTLQAIAAQAGAALLVENDARLAVRAGADGAHFTQAGALAEAVASLQPERIVGAGLLRSRDDAMSAGEAGVDYVMFGEPRPDGYTPNLLDTLERVAWWAEIFEPPCVAYAGRLEDIAPLAAAGADFVALGEALWSASSLSEAARRASASLVRAGV